MPLYIISPTVHSRSGLDVLSSPLYIMGPYPTLTGLDVLSTSLVSVPTPHERVKMSPVSCLYSTGTDKDVYAACVNGFEFLSNTIDYVPILN